MKPALRTTVRAVIASALANRMPVRESIGPVRLMASQIDGVRRAFAAIQRYGGVLIADDVGSGKTFLALAVARDFAAPLVVAPAALRQMWAAASARSGVEVTFASLESLARGREVPGQHGIVVIDEAHHLRNAGTEGHAAVRALVRDTPVILLTATPVHNRRDDLVALLSFFLGRDAADLDDEARANVIVSREGATPGPEVVTHAALAVDDNADIVRAICALPTPLATLDGGDAPGLLRIAFLRAWCSSVGALRSMLRRSSLQSAALLDGLRANRHLARKDLDAWRPRLDGQLALPELIASVAESSLDVTVAETHLTALESLRDLTRPLVTIDDRRADMLRAIVGRHAGVPVLACTQYAETVRAMWSRLRTSPGVAALTASGAMIASGPVSREYALSRFAPQAMHARSPHERERIRLLITTDVVSEGLNLQDAGVVVHLDLPWTTARLAQRVGRIARAGSPHTAVHAYTFAPPDAAAALLDLEGRLAHKRRIAAELVGGDARLAALLGVNESIDGVAAARSRVLALLERWVTEISESHAVACGVTAPSRGWLALIDDGDESRLVARIGSAAPSTDPRIVLTAVEWLAENEEHWLPASWEASVDDAKAWVAAERARILAGAHRPNASRERQRTLGLSMLALAGAAPHDRVRAAARETTKLQPAAPPHRAPSMSLRALVVFCSYGEDEAPDGTAV